LSQLPEPWLRGVLPGLDPVIGHLLRSSQQIREDLTRAIAHLTVEQLWTPPSPGFHAKHLAGSTQRLCTYLEGHQLNETQLAELSRESEPGESAAALLKSVELALDRYEALLRTLPPEHFNTIREVGRQRLQTTAIGLAIHIAEHGQRHTGQAISLGHAASAAFS
jgi:uncharacterized damage-inducible protein DinB